MMDIVTDTANSDPRTEDKWPAIINSFYQQLYTQTGLHKLKQSHVELYTPIVFIDSQNTT